MIDCLEKQQQQLQNNQLQLINVSISQQSSLNTNHRPPNQNPPPYQPLNSAPNPVALLNSVYPQQHYHPQQQQRSQSLQRQPLRPLADSTNQQQSGNELIGYYFGSISRETAEWILKTHGNNMNGAYLLRSSGPNDDFVLSLLVNHVQNSISNSNLVPIAAGNLEVLHYKIVETEDSFVALHGQVGDEKFATIDELIDKAQGVATKPRWPIRRQTLESQILPPTYWGLTVDQVRLAILIKAKQWGFPLLSSLLQQQDQLQQLTTNLNSANNSIQQQNQIPTTTMDSNQLATEISLNTLNNETIRTLIYKSLHEFQPWFHGKISREESERNIEEGAPRDGKFLVRERDNYSYAMCISHKKTTKHYRIDVLPTGELAIQDGRKFTSLMALVSHYTIMSDGLWCALTEACPRPINDVGRSVCCDNTPLSGLTATLNNNGFVANSQMRIQPPINNCYNNSTAVNQQQNLYGVPLISNNNNSNSHNSAHNLILPGPMNNIIFGNIVNENSLANSHSTQQQTNLTDDAPVNASSKSQSGLICSHQGGVVSLKTPIREWLQTINHKWSQLMASKNQHHSLNSFLFGNQNPLNNHCRYNHRDHGHSMNHRYRKCKNGHTSCACIRQQMMLANRAQEASTTHEATMRRGVQQQSVTHKSNAAAQSTFNRYQAGIHNCCSGAGGTTSYSATKSLSQNGSMPNNFHSKQNNPATYLDQNQHNNLNLTTSALLSRLPLNSGFTMSSQSFVGSPLFAVKQAQSEKNKLLQAGSGSQGSSSSNSGTSNTVEEERLISPVQSISGNLNNPYNFDVYGGSQTSTALVNDQLPACTSSSSSSETNRLIQRNLNSTNNPLSGQLQYGSAAAKMINRNDHIVALDVQQKQGSTHAGPILCGQHAGPAFRYTNCNDENNYNPCFHRPHAPCRAADDSQLATTSTQLTCPAAMSKFVQFQDGQCLRTHRDTRSIQMAYLSSRPNNNNGARQNQHHQSHNNQVPLRELNAHQQKNNNSQLYLAKKNTTPNLNGVQCVASTYINNNLHRHGNTSGLFKTNLLAKTRQLNHEQAVPNHQNSQFCESQENNGKSFGDEIDLMDCGEDQNFKYDPKLIKSSSIETLCGLGGGGDEDANLDDLVNCKTNTELIMSLQSCWVASQQQSNMLRPIQCTGDDTTLYNEGGCLDQEAADPNGESILSSLMVDSSQNEQLDHMKKKHDLDELTTNLLAELTASLKAQVDLKNKRSGYNNNSNNNLHNMEKGDTQQQQHQQSAKEVPVNAELNPLELINEFDTLIPNNNR